MAASIKTFENSLRDYLINTLSDSYDKPEDLFYKFNNLKVYMEIEDALFPNFCVSMNISSVRFSLEPLIKISGSLGTFDNYVLRWAKRPNIYGELKNHWNYLIQINTKVNDENEDKISNNDIREANDSVTGSGVKVKKKNIGKFKYEDIKRTGR